MTQSEDPLTRMLGAGPPAAVAALDEAVRAELATVIAEARRKQGADLQEAFAAALKHVPFPVRGIVKKVLL